MLYSLTVKAPHARGLAVHAWVNVNLVWGLGDPPLVYQF